MARGKRSGSYFFLYGIFKISILAIHLYCCWLAYTLGTFGQVILSFFAPVFAEIYWFVKVWQLAGGITWFNLWVIGTVALFFVALGLKILTDTLHNKRMQSASTGVNTESAPINATPAGFCRACGQPIDPESYQCTGCGKQYNKGKMLWKKSRAKGGRIVVGVLIVALAGICVGQYLNYTAMLQEWEEAYTVLIQEMEERIHALELEDLKSLINEPSAGGFIEDVKRERAIREELSSGKYTYDDLVKLRYPNGVPGQTQNNTAAESSGNQTTQEDTDANKIQSILDKIRQRVTE